MTNEVFKDYIERMQKRRVTEITLAVLKEYNDHNSCGYEIGCVLSSVTLISALNEIVSDMAKEIFGALPEEATERTSAKIREDYAMSYDECLSWNACRKAFLENIKKLK